MLSMGLPMTTLHYTKCFTLQEVTPPKAEHVPDSIFFENHRPGLHYCCIGLIEENRQGLQQPEPKLHTKMMKGRH